MFGKGSVSSDAINQHREMAGAASKGNFGVKGLPQRDASHPDAGKSYSAMDDGSRGAGPGIGGKGVAMQRAPDHGGVPASHFRYEGKA